MTLRWNIWIESIPIHYNVLPITQKFSCVKLYGYDFYNYDIEDKISTQKSS